MAEFIPIKHAKSRSHEELEVAIFEKVRDCSSRLSSYVQVQKAYLDIVYSCESFGQIYYKCRQKSSKKLPESLVLSAHAAGITLYDKSRKVVASMHLKEMVRWGYTKVVYSLAATRRFD